MSGRTLARSRELAAPLFLGQPRFTARLALMPAPIAAVIARSTRLPVGGSKPSWRIIVALS
jgi:hypothetical protein